MRCRPPARCSRTRSSTRARSPPRRWPSPATSASTPTATWWSKNCERSPARVAPPVARGAGAAPGRRDPGRGRSPRRRFPPFPANHPPATGPPPMTDPASSSTMTPREIVQELDRHIIGQQTAKRAVAIALRNRWRRAQLPDELRNEVMPKNILMIGPTGVGKTEIARRLATLANAPFVKVEATRFTEVGYVGKDVEQIIRDLADTAVKLYREQAKKKVRTQAEERAEERILDALLPRRETSPPAFGFGVQAATVDIGAEPSAQESETRQKL